MVILIIIITFPYSTCISSFLVATSLLLCSFFKMFFRSFFNVILCNIANVLRTFEIVQRSRSRKQDNIINYIDKNVERTSTVCMHKSRDFHMRGTT